MCSGVDRSTRNRESHDMNGLFGFFFACALGKPFALIYYLLNSDFSQGRKFVRSWSHQMGGFGLVFMLLNVFLLERANN